MNAMIHSMIEISNVFHREEDTIFRCSIRLSYSHDFTEQFRGTLRDLKKML